MRLNRFLLVGAVATLAACTDATTPTRAVDPSPFAAANSESLGFDFASYAIPKGFPTVSMANAARSAAAVTAGPPILYHTNGRVIPQPRVAAIYWSNSVIYPSGPTPGTVGVGAADGSVIGGFLRSLGGTSYWSINNDYTDNVQGNHRVANNLNYTRFHANNVGAPAPGATVTDNAIRTMLTSVVGTANLPFDQQTIYVVFGGTGVNLGGGFGTSYCAYHGFFPRPGFPGQWILYAVMPYSADQVGACTAINTPGTGSPNEFAADAAINLITASLDASYTDPGSNAWFDAGGLE